jgi:hypothetical protein
VAVSISMFKIYFIYQADEVECGKNAVSKRVRGNIKVEEVDLCVDIVGD